MMDFAEIKNISQDSVKIKERSEVRAISINPLSLALTIVFSLLIYFAGYQNMVIEQAKHEINEKKSILNTLITEKQNLTKKQKSLVNSKNILKENLEVATPNNVKIVH